MDLHVVLTAGRSPFGAQSASEEQVFVSSHPSSSPIEYRGDAYGVPHRINNYLSSHTHIRRMFLLFSTVALAAFLILGVYRCLIKSTGNGRLRRLASGGGDEGQGSRVGLCGAIEALLSHVEENDEGAAVLQAETATPEAATGEAPAKKKKKTKWLEEGSGKPSTAPEPLSEFSSQPSGEEASFPAPPFGPQLSPSLLDAENFPVFDIKTAGTPVLLADKDNLPDAYVVPEPTSSAAGSSSPEHDEPVLIEEWLRESSSGAEPLVAGWEFNEELLGPAAEPAPDPVPESHRPHGVQQSLVGSPGAAGSQKMHHVSAPPGPGLQKNLQEERGVLSNDAAPSTSKAPSGGATSTSQTPPHSLFALHPFYRLPRAKHGASPPPFNAETAFSSEGPGGGLPARLGSLREVLIKEEAHDDDIKYLVANAYFLVSYTKRWSSQTLAGRKSHHVFENFARRLLVTDSLFAICEVVGPTMKQREWWARLMARVRIPQLIGDHPPRWCRIFDDFREAFDDYSAGGRPGAEALVQLKRKIFCKPCLHWNFESFRWDSFRRDDEEFRQATGNR